MKRAIVVLCLTLFLMMSLSACQTGEEPLLDEDELRELEVRVANDNCRWTERWLIEDQELIDEMISLIVDHVQVLRPYARLGFIFENINVTLDEDRRPYAPAVFFHSAVQSQAERPDKTPPKDNKAPWKKSLRQYSSLPAYRCLSPL